MIRGLRVRKVHISAMRDRADLETLFGEEATAEVLRFIENTEVGQPPVKEENREDYWDIEQLDQRSDGAEVISEDGGE